MLPDLSQSCLTISRYAAELHGWVSCMHLSSHDLVNSFFFNSKYILAAFYRLEFSYFKCMKFSLWWSALNFCKHDMISLNLANITQSEEFLTEVWSHSFIEEFFLLTSPKSPTPLPVFSSGFLSETCSLIILGFLYSQVWLLEVHLSN